MKTLLFGLFIIGGWTLVLGFVGSICAFALMWMGLVPYLPSLLYLIPLLGFAVGISHFRAILRSK